MKTIRVVIFPERPDALLLVVADGEQGPVVLPPLPVPFQRDSVAASLRRAGTDARVGEEAAGRWTGAMVRARREARAERHQRQRLGEATAAALAKGSSDDIQRERGDAIRRKLEIDGEIADLKAKIKRAKSTAYTTGAYMDPVEYRGMESRLGRLGVESLALQNRLTELRAKEKERNVARHQAETRTFERKFIEAAREFLDPDDFRELVAVAEDPNED